MITMPANTTTAATDEAANGSPEVTQEATATGGGYRAVIKRDGEVIWSCPHVHFTEHSARSCPAAARYLATAA